MNNQGKQTGLSLIELMIAMVVGLILMAGVLSIFISSRQGYGVNTAVAQVQENGRFALLFIGSAARNAGYMGCGGSNDTIANHLNSPDNTTLPYDFANAITGFEYTGTAPTNAYVIASENPAPAGVGNWNPALPNNFPTAGTGYPITGSDALVLRFTPPAATTGYVTGAPAPAGSQFTLTTNPGISTGQVLAISNCVNTYVVQANNVTGNTVEIDTTGGVTPSNAVTGIPALFIGAQVSVAKTVVFYIGEGADQNPDLFEATSDPSQPSGFSIQDVVPDVENMQVLYGVDTDADQTPNQYVTADNVANWTDVVSVRVAMLVRSNTGALPVPATAPFYTLEDTTVNVPRDTRLRRVFTATLQLRNR